MCSFVRAHSQGVRYAFGVVGVPVTSLALAFQEFGAFFHLLLPFPLIQGIAFVAMRNEQSASYAASIIVNFDIHRYHETTHRLLGLSYSSTSHMFDCRWPWLSPCLTRPAECTSQ